MYCKKHNNKLEILKELFEKEMESIITRVVIIAFKEISKSYQNFEMKHIYEIVNLASRETGKKINLTNNIICENLYGNIVLSKNDNKYRDFLRMHPVEALNNSNNYFELNEIESDIILSHMYPITKDKPKYAESKVVCITDKLVSYYEFFRYQLNFSANFAFLFLLRFIRFY